MSRFDNNPAKSASNRVGADKVVGFFQLGDSTSAPSNTPPRQLYMRELPFGHERVRARMPKVGS
jgi:hypothetical protein